MLSGILAGITWAIETIILAWALSLPPFSMNEKAIFLAPFASTFLHDTFSALWALCYNIIKKNMGKVIKAIKTPDGKFIILAAIIGGPLGMTGYVIAVSHMGAAIGAIATAIFPAIGSVLACIFLKEKMQWYRWIFLLITLTGVLGLSYSPEIDINNYLLGISGALMCSFGWGIEAVILAKCLRSNYIKDEYALLIRQATSALFYILIILPIIGGVGFSVKLLISTGSLIPIISLAGLFATVSYLFYYKAIAKIGAAKATALDVSYSAWAILFSYIIYKNTEIINPVTVICTMLVLVGGILTSAEYSELFKSNH